MTRYTRAFKKTHVEAGGFQVSPLKPAQTESNSSVNHSDAQPNATSTHEGPRGKKRAANRDESAAKDRKTSESKPKRIRNEKKLQEWKAKRSEARRLQRQKLKHQNTICYVCREKGHSAQICPKAAETGVGICYNCGSSEHTTKTCTKPRNKNPYKFASCFVCNGQGHLASQCPQNSKGLYPNGGSCRFCGKVDHLAKDCALTKEEVGTSVVGKIDLEHGADDDDFHIFVSEKNKLQKEVKLEKAVEKRQAKAKKIVKF
ncbi:uncharacterized protein VTP21DRAFT_1201 [Calcarisporiella thermophila]|uniref:uncharacterized protein n=1 Tax=Calcarisporiella thermophila TaxID=911321 RepID=UPI00374259CB